MRVNSTQKELGNEGRKEGASVYDVHVRKEEKGGLRIKPICEQTVAYGGGGSNIIWTSYVEATWLAFYRSAYKISLKEIDRPPTWTTEEVSSCRHCFFLPLRSEKQGFVVTDNLHPAGIRCKWNARDPFNGDGVGSGFLR